MSVLICYNINMIGLQSVKTEDLEILSSLADEVWHQAYDNLLGPSQVDYMIKKFQSKKAFIEQIQKGYEYYFILASGVICGYLGILQEDKRMFLSKIYLRAGHCGQGIAQIVLNKIQEEGKARKLKEIYLTVNKNNDRAIKAYERFGFIKTDSIVTDIGNGYVMDDYVYTFVI